MDTLLQDLRYALRSLRKSPGFALVAVVTLALGIGVNSSIFSLVSAILFRPLPVERPHELVDVYARTATSDGYNTLSYPDYQDIREQTEVLSDVMGYTNFFANLSIEGSSELVVGEIVTESYFPLLGVGTARGRTFSPEEFAAVGAAPVAVISHGFWENRFGADPDVLGRTFRLNGIPYEIIGVAPESFGGMLPAVTAQMWIPTTMVEEVEPLGNQWGHGSSPGPTRLERRSQRWLNVKGRMKPGVEIGQVRAELEGITARLSEQYPETNDIIRAVVLATNDVAVVPDLDAAIAPAGLVLLGAVGLVLLVACANLANMLLARAATRRRELAVRVAIGAGAARIVRQMLTESLVLALAGGAAAVGLAYGITGLIGRVQPPLPIDLGLDVSPDWRVLAFTLVIALATGVAFGLLPALRAARPDLVPALKDSGDGEGGGRGVSMRDVLVVGQVAVSLVLLVGGALLVRSLDAAQDVDFGYDVDRVAFLAVAMEMNGYDGERAEAFTETARLRLESLPEVGRVGVTSRVPLSLNNNGFGIFIDGHQSSGADRPYRMDGARVDEAYFDALGLDVVAGRPIEAADRDENRRVAVVSRAMAERYWPGEDPLGKEFRVSWGADPHRIVGVVEQHKVDTPGEAPKPYLYLPLRRQALFANFMVETTTPAATLVPALERELRRLDADLVFLDTGTLRELADVRLFPIQVGAWFIGVFGVLALALAAVGLYGVIGYAVSRRRREIGVRKALGAESSRVIRLVVRRGVLLVGVGGLLGGVLAVLASRAISGVLFVSVFDPASFLVSFGFLFLVGVAANWVPAWRAASVDPMLALRSE